MPFLKSARRNGKTVESFPELQHSLSVEGLDGSCGEERSDLKYTENGPVGLALGFFGVTDVRIVRVDGVAMGDNRKASARDAARDAIPALVKGEAKP